MSVPKIIVEVSTYNNQLILSAVSSHEVDIAVIDGDSTKIYKKPVIVDSKYVDSIMELAITLKNDGIDHIEDYYSIEVKVIPKRKDGSLYAGK